MAEQTPQNPTSEIAGQAPKESASTDSQGKEKKMEEIEEWLALLDVLVRSARTRNTLQDVVETFGKDGKVLRGLSTAAKIRIREEVFFNRPPSPSAASYMKEAWEKLQWISD